MRNWFRFFLGTPRRALTTAAVIALLALFERLAPGVMGDSIRALLTAILTAVLGTLQAFWPQLFPILLQVAIMAGAFLLLRKGFRTMTGGGKRRRR